MNKLALPSLLMATVLLSACDYKINTNVYVSDTISLEESTKVNATLMGGGGSLGETTCNDKLADFTRVVSNYFEVKSSECLKDGFNVFAAFDVYLNVYTSTAEVGNDVISLHPDSSPESSWMLFQGNKEMFERLEAALRDLDSTISIDPKDIEFNVTIVNDTREAQRVYFGSVKVGNEYSASSSGGYVDLNPRDEVTATLSPWDVGYTLQGNGMLPFTVAPK